MAKQNEHGRLIAAAAKATLTPLGCKRKGQSRFWYSDERFWAISIEFQPSGWSKGSYLNVGAKWLWCPKSDWGFSEDPRVEDVGFIPFENAEQFTPLIATMAVRAAQEVIERREKFNSIVAIYENLLARVTREGWPVYHAAVAAGLVGDISMSRQLFKRMADWPTYGYDSQLKLKSDAAALEKFVGEPAQFRSAVAAIIADVRSGLRLAFDAELLQALDSKAAT